MLEKALLTEKFSPILLSFKEKLFKCRKSVTMAFNIPLMRNDYDIYKINNARSRSIPVKQNSGRSRKASESQSLSTSPGTHDAFINSPSHRNLQHVSSAGSRYQFTRVNSRASQSSLIVSPTRSQYVSNPSPPKPAKVGSQNSLNKFHNRLVDKLRKAFKSSNSSSEENTRSWKSHSVDLSSPFRRPISDQQKKASASSAAILVLERQFQLMEMDRASDSEANSDDDEERCEEKFILIWISGLSIPLCGSVFAAVEKYRNGFLFNIQWREA